MENIGKIAKSACLVLALGSISVMNVMGESLGISHLVSEQNIVTIKKTTSNYLLLPIQDNAPEAKVYIVKDGLQMNVAVNVRLAREHIDYYVPLNLLEYQGKDIAIDILGMPANALCWDSLKLSNVFDMPQIRN